MLYCSTQPTLQGECLTSEHVVYCDSRTPFLSDWASSTHHTAELEVQICSIWQNQKRLFIFALMSGKPRCLFSVVFALTAYCSIDRLEGWQWKMSPTVWWDPVWHQEGLLSAGSLDLVQYSFTGFGFCVYPEIKKKEKNLCFL